jgi:hypothetical protein
MTESVSKPTTDRNHIRLWASSQNAMPAEVLPAHVNSAPTQLHFFIPGDESQQPRLRIIGWDDFFAAFEAHGLCFAHEILPDGNPGKRFEILQIDENSPAHKHILDSDSAPDYAE